MRNETRNAQLDRRPDMNTLLQISRILCQPVSFFFKETNINLNKKKVRFFRSVGPKSNKINMALDVRTNWLWEFVQTLLDAGIRLPTPNVPFYDDVEHDSGYGENFAAGLRTPQRFVRSSTGSTQRH